MSNKLRTNKGTFAKGTSGNPGGKRKEIRADGWYSALTGIGTSTHDKRESHNFMAKCLTYQEAVELWRGDDLAKRAIESVPDGCFRQGYEITIADEGNFEELKEDIEEQLSKLKVDAAIKKAMCYERAYGGAAILLGTNDARSLDKELDITRVTKIEWLNVLEPCEVYPVSYYDDPMAPKYGEPEYYQLATFPQTSSMVPASKKKKAPNQLNPLQLIHESRLVVFEGTRVSRYQSRPGLSGLNWGDSILTYLADVLRDFNIAWHSAGIIVTDFSQAVFSIENLMSLVARDPDKLQARIQAIELSRSTARAVLVDTKEKFERQSTSVAGLPDLLDRLSTRLAAAIDMPLSLLMGQSPTNLGADSDSDVRFYYDRIQSYQRDKVGPILKMFAQMIMQGLRKRKLPKKWGIRFHPLWQLTDQQKAEARLAQARVDEIYINMGVLHPQETRQTRFGGEYSYETQIDESKEAPGFVSLPPKGVGEEAAAAAEGSSEGVGATAHGVESYTRRNPRTQGTNAGSAKPKVTDQGNLVTDSEEGGKPDDEQGG
jgi:phage-related protein (TIGR01555 family)